MATICSFSGGKNCWADVSIILNAIIAVSGSLEGAGRFIYNPVKVSDFCEHDTIGNNILILDKHKYISLIKSYPFLKKAAMGKFIFTYHLSTSGQLCICTARGTTRKQSACQRAM